MKKIDLSVSIYTDLALADSVLAATNFFRQLLEHTSGELVTQIYEGGEHILRLYMPKDEAQVATELVLEKMGAVSPALALQFKSHVDAAFCTFVGFGHGRSVAFSAHFKGGGVDLQDQRASLTRDALD